MLQAGTLSHLSPAQILFAKPPHDTRSSYLKLFLSSRICGLGYALALSFSASRINNQLVPHLFLFRYPVQLPAEANMSVAEKDPGSRVKSASPSASDDVIAIEIPSTIREKQLLRKLDRTLLPALTLIYLLSFLDRSNGIILFSLWLLCSWWLTWGCVSWQRAPGGVDNRSTHEYVPSP